VKGLGKSKDERAMLKALMKAIEEGELTPDEAQKLGSLIDISLKIKNTEEMEHRLKVLENANTTGFNDGEFTEVPDS
jgi:ribosome-binding protein aMBF1 (putative translation factor)